MMTVEQDTIDQYWDGQDLLSATLIKRQQVLQELERIAKAAQGSGGIESIVEFPLVNAQTLLFELSVIGESIETLIFEINRYAERCGKPPVQVTKREFI